MIAGENQSSLSEADIDDIVRATFFDEKSEEDNNLQFVRDMLTKRVPDIRFFCM